MTRCTHTMLSSKNQTFLVSYTNIKVTVITYALKLKKLINNYIRSKINEDLKIQITRIIRQ